MSAPAPNLLQPHRKPTGAILGFSGSGACQEQGFDVLPDSPGTVAGYLNAEACRGAKASTIQRRCAAIRYVHRSGGRPGPTEDERVGTIMRGIGRTNRAAPRRVAPATDNHIIAMVPRPDGGLPALRDRALLLLALQGLFAALSWSPSTSPTSRRIPMGCA
jgi:hypothetical protein